ncbi:extracellular calcium-sensing receptor-like [Lepisosteus oculatus]|nr:PREDICTED: extracellular calcium-sensing receptor-like [Lepisosteus oculatus]
MALVIITPLLILAWLPTAEATESVCMLWDSTNLPSLFRDGDIVLGGLFPLYDQLIVTEDSYRNTPELPHCINLKYRSFRWAQGMVFAIEEINQDSSLLPNIRLGYRILDSCGKHPLALRGAFSALSRQSSLSPGNVCTGSGAVPVIIGDTSSTQSIILSKTLGPFQVPLVSYSASCACLSNRREYPNFFRTIPSDFYQARTMAQMVMYFGWPWVGAIATDNDYGILGIQMFAEQVKTAGVCIAFFETVSKVFPKRDAVRIAEVVKASTARVIIVFAFYTDVEVVFEELVKQNVTGRQFIGSEGWSTSPTIYNKDFSSLSLGVLGVAIRRAQIPGMESFLVSLHPSKYPGNPFVRELWETSFHCRLNGENATTLGNLPACSGSENLATVKNTFTDVSQLRITYNVYKAVYAVAHALHNLQACKDGNGPFENNSCGDIYNLKSGQLLHYLSEVQFTNKLGENVHFEGGDSKVVYDIVNWQKSPTGSMEYVTIGRVDGSDIFINEKAIVWTSGKKEVPVSICTEDCPPGTRKATRKGEPSCCFDCILCAEGELSNTTNSLQCDKCPLEYWSNAYRNECIPRDVEFLSFEDTMGITLTTVALSGASITLAVAIIFLYYKNTPIVRANNSELSFLLLFSLMMCFLCSLCFIGKPSIWSCKIQHIAFGVSFVLCISCLLVKTIVVLMAFQATLPGNDVMKWFGPTQQRSSVIVCTLIQVLQCAVWLSVSPPLPNKNTSYQNSKIILECAVGSIVAFCCVLGYIGLLACLCFTLAFLARNLPDNFNEGKFITFSMLIFCAVWITFIPAYISSPGKYTVAVEIFAILSSSFGLLGCIFAPKCFIILLRPENNTKKFLMGRASA